MVQTPRENTLLLGNGFSRSVFYNVPSWGELFDGVTTSVQNYTILYEKYLLQKRKEGKSEEDVKRDLVTRIKNFFTGTDIRSEICNTGCFGEYLRKYNINNILTTNYDNGIEFVLKESCEYEEAKITDIVPEKIYSIRTYKLFVHKDTGHKIKLWKIHGDLNRIRSITLGYDHYCGTLSKLSEYIKGTYRSSTPIRYRGAMKNKCEYQIFDGISWVELFFRTDLYIAGFGLDFSEIDIWWILNKRARMMTEIPKIKNKVVYLYNEKFESPAPHKENVEEKKNQQAKFETLDAFNVVYYPMENDKDYIKSIFLTMSRYMNDN